jgi:hypothetical protein
MPTKQLEGKIAAGHVIIAECPSPQPSSPSTGRVGKSRLPRWQKRSVLQAGMMLGFIYQLNVRARQSAEARGARCCSKRSSSAARTGGRLYCCWWRAGHRGQSFWESDGGSFRWHFRAGSRQKGRVHIFWHDAFGQENVTTPYWFPAQTSSGSIREDRLVASP